MLNIRDAASIVVIRSYNKKNLVLMGRRGSQATFMPSKYVFPGGAWEPDDCKVPTSTRLGKQDRQLLELDSKVLNSSSLGVTAIRELWEETGLRISSPIPPVNVPDKWMNFFSNGYGPNLEPLQFFFRAVTPPGRTRRFDARFFVCNAKYILGDVENFSRASMELSDLRWVNITETNELDLPQITKIVVRQVVKLIDLQFEFKSIPFYNGGSDGSENKLLKI